MVLAAQEHDSGWWDWEIKPTLEQGYPSDYIGNVRPQAKAFGWICIAAPLSGLRMGSHAAYFVSMHGEALLTQGMGLLPSMPDYTGDPAVQKFIAQQRSCARNGCRRCKETKPLPP